MPYRIAGIDVHKKILAVVVSNVEIESEYQFERRMFGSNPEQLRSLAAWLLEQEAEEVVMESTAQYWKDRKSTRLNSSHSQISYAVFCLKKKKNKNTSNITSHQISYDEVL